MVASPARNHRYTQWAIPSGSECEAFGGGPLALKEGLIAHMAILAMLRRIPTGPHPLRWLPCLMLPHGSVIGEGGAAVQAPLVAVCAARCTKGRWS
jgi:hypothetical protein